MSGSKLTIATSSGLSFYLCQGEASRKGEKGEAEIEQWRALFPLIRDGLLVGMAKLSVYRKYICELRIRRSPVDYIFKEVVIWTRQRERADSTSEDKSGKKRRFTKG